MKVEKTIKGGMTEYKVELKLIDSSNFNRLEFEVYARERGEKKMEFFGILLSSGTEVKRTMAV